MDKLQECAKMFKKLIDIKYCIIIGRKGKVDELEITFESADFHHIIGLHKLKDIESLSGKRETVFKEILKGNILMDSIEKSLYIRKIGNRIKLFANIENILDNNNLIFKYNKNANTYSLIQAEYLLSTTYKTNEVYIFLDRKNNNKHYFCRSFFPKENKDYTIGQPKFTLLYKEKITISTGEKIIQFNRLSKNDKS